MRLLHRHTLRQIPRLIDICTTAYGDSIRQPLQRNDVEDGREEAWRFGDLQHVVRFAARSAISFLDQANDKTMNPYGIDIRPYIDISFYDIRSHQGLLYQKAYLAKLKELIQAKAGKVKLVDPASETISKIKKYLDNEPETETSLEKGKKHQFFLSDITPKFQNIASKWLGRSIEVQKASLEE